MSDAPIIYFDNVGLATSGIPYCFIKGTFK